jgi:hypothetical protein
MAPHIPVKSQDILRNKKEILLNEATFTGMGAAICLSMFVD